MSVDSYWQRLKTANPDLCNSKRLTISIEVFEKCIRNAYIEGVQHAVKSQGLFDRIFGTHNR